MSACATPQQIEAEIAASEEKVPAGFTRLTGDALVEFVSDSTISGLSERSPGWSYDVYRAPDGTQRGISKKGSDTSKDSGNWTMNGDTYCSRWKNWADGKENCFRLYSSEATKEYYSVSTKGKFWSSSEFEASRLKGNSKNL